MANGSDRIAVGANPAKVALVTGASSGIGRAIARQLAADGFRVFGTSRNGSAAPEGGIEIIELDVCSDQSVEGAMKALIAKAGRIDVAVNNAGYLLGGAVEETSMDEAKAQFETNFFGAFRVIKALLPTMRAQGSERIINITSLAGVVPLPFWGLYCASKFALEGLTESLRHEMRPFGISVSAIEAGAIKSRFYTDDRKAQPIAAYDRWHHRFRKTMATFYRKAPGPEAVARAVSKAVGARKPALRYRVTPEATQFTLMRTWLPSALFEFGLRQGFHLDDARY